MHWWVGLVLIAPLAGMGLVAAGCGSGSGTTLPPIVVTSTVPPDGATGIALTVTVTATFNQQMNASTINSSTFVVSDPAGLPVPGTVDYDSVNFVASFTPDAPLKPNTTYTAGISGGVANVGDAILGDDFDWMFTTGP